MVKRRELQHVHEGAVLQEFSTYLQKQGSTFKILDKPDPPEAFVEINNHKTWVEITDAYLDSDHAIGLTTGVSEDVPHISDSSRLVIDPDAQFSSVLQSVISKKYDKNTMHSLYHSQGAGVLLVGIFTPFALASEIAQDESENIASLIAQKPIMVFDKIYVYDGTGQRSFHLIFR